LTRTSKKKKGKNTSTYEQKKKGKSADPPIEYRTSWPKLIGIQTISFSFEGDSWVLTMHLPEIQNGTYQHSKETNLGSYTKKKESKHRSINLRTLQQYV
jgi:hypothetical protein